MESSIEIGLAVNATWLRQMTELLSTLTDVRYQEVSPVLGPQRVGGHVRHILEFYECFLAGLFDGTIDYDARPRDREVEDSRTVAISRASQMLARIESLAALEDLSMMVRAEGEPRLLRSSVGRELQALSSHTIHHFALISMLLRVRGERVHPDFGMSPATLIFQQRQKERAA